MSHFVRTPTKREILADFGDKKGSFGSALEQYLNQLPGEVISVHIEGSDITVVGKAAAKPKSSDK